MTYWAEEPYAVGVPTPPELLAPLALHLEVVYLQHLAAQTALDWGQLAESIDPEPVPKWVQAAMGELENVVDGLGELLVILDANMPKNAPVNVEACPWCGEVFQAPADHDPLKHHMDYCPNAPVDAEADPKWLCVTCNADAENPVAHEDSTGHWPKYAHD